MLNSEYAEHMCARTQVATRISVEVEVTNRGVHKFVMTNCTHVQLQKGLGCRKARQTRIFIRSTAISLYK